jgi:hypothetical protein
MIKINKISPQTVEVFDNNEQSLGFVNEWEFNDLRIQIAEQNISGYFIIFNGKRTIIEENGEILNWPNDLFNLGLKQFGKLFKLRKKIFN